MRASEFITEAVNTAKYNGLVMKYAFNDNALALKAFTKDGPVAFVKFFKEKKELYPQNLWVHDEYRNRGIAKSMYDYLKSEGYEINRSHDQTKAGAGFWDKHRGEDAYVWEEINPDIRNPEFYHEQQIGDYKYTAKTQPSQSGYFTYLLIRCYDGDKLIGKVNFEIRILAGKKWLESQQTEVASEYQQKGIASTMYAYAKMLGNDVKPSKYQSDMGKAMWAGWKKSGDAKHLANEEIIDEMPLPADWDPQQFSQDKTTFKSRLAYALERAKKLGTGSSRVATVIEYEGRPTVLKIAKNTKGLAQNGVEASILDDGYASQLGILIPLIDYDTENRDPLWIHTEMATKANEKQLCHLMKCDSLNQLVRFADTIAGKYRNQTAQSFIENLVNDGKSQQDIDTMSEYANTLADLANSFDVELGDFNRAANWGLYQGKPVVIDVGFNRSVYNQYYKR